MPTSAEILSILIVVFALISCGVYTLTIIRHKKMRELNIIIAIASLWLAVVFLLNSLGIMINSGGFLGGRPPTIILLAAITSRAIYSYRNGG
jgi:hypothetical protein